MGGYSVSLTKHYVRFAVIMSYTVEYVAGSPCFGHWSGASPNIKKGHIKCSSLKTGNVADSNSRKGEGSLSCRLDHNKQRRKLVVKYRASFYLDVFRRCVFSSDCSLYFTSAPFILKTLSPFTPVAKPSLLANGTPKSSWGRKSAFLSALSSFVVWWNFSLKVSTSLPVCFWSLAQRLAPGYATVPMADGAVEGDSKKMLGGTTVGEVELLLKVLSKRNHSFPKRLNAQTAFHHNHQLLKKVEVEARPL